MAVLNQTYVDQSVSLRMIESWGAGAGDLGEYDDCMILNLDSRVKAQHADVQYCWVGTSVNSAVGLCVPTSCAEGSALLDQIKLLEKAVKIPPAIFGNYSSLVAQCGTHDSSISVEGRVAVAIIICLAFLVLFASLDAWRKELSTLFQKGWVCFDRKEQVRAQKFLRDAAPVQHSFNNSRFHRDPVTGRSPKPNQYSSSDTDGEPGYSPVPSQQQPPPLSLAAARPNAAGGKLSGGSAGEVGARNDTTGRGGLCLQAFSSRSNYNELMSRDFRPLAPLHALRVLATIWIVLGNTVAYMVPVLKESNGISLVMNVEHNWGVQWVVGSYFAVDIFFVLSGFFAGHSFIVQLKAANRIGTWKPIRKLHYGCIDIPRMYLYRFFRVLPSLAFVLLGFVGLTDLMNPGPLHFLYEAKYINPCRKFWWTNLLFINNFYPPGTADGSAVDICMDWTWYLAVDWNLYLVAPFFVLLFWKNRTVGILTVTLTILGSICFQIYIGMMYEYSMNPLKHVGRSRRAENYIYDAYNFAGYNKPWTRCIPYLMGLASAMWFHRVGAKIRLSQRFVVLGYLLTIFLFIFVVVVAPANYFAGIKRFSRDQRNHTSAHRERSTPDDIIHDGSYYGNPNWSVEMCVLYSVFSHVVVAVTCVYSVVVLATGHGGFLRRFLKLYAWTPLSRLSFGVYLIHPILITAGYTGAFSLEFYEPLTAVTTWIAMTCLSFALAFFVHIGIERPCKKLSAALLLGGNTKGPCCGAFPEAKSLANRLEEEFLQDDEEGGGIPR